MRARSRPIASRGPRSSRTTTARARSLCICSCPEARDADRRLGDRRLQAGAARAAEARAGRCRPHPDRLDVENRARRDDDPARNGSSADVPDPRLDASCGRVHSGSLGTHRARGGAADRVRVARPRRARAGADAGRPALCAATGGRRVRRGHRRGRARISEGARPGADRPRRPGALACDRACTPAGGTLSRRPYPSVPTYPAWHGCIRVPMWIAVSLYAQIPAGSSVYVYL